MSFKKLSIVFLFLAIVSCEEKPTSFDWGLVEDNVYKNKFFSFSLPIPKGWIYDDKHSIYWAENTNLPGKAAYKSAYDSGNLMTTDPGSIKNSPLFLLQMPNKQGQNFQPNIYFNVENAAQIDGIEIKNVDDYLNYNLNSVKKAPALKLDSDDFTKVSIGGRSFFKITGTFTAENNDKILQHYYLTLNNGFGFVVTLSATSKEDLNKLEDTFKNADF